jgi:F-type H+-transporting ATPase subunit epsilon
MKCDIVSARKTIFSGEATMLVASGTAGELGITPGHIPLMTTLKAGPVRLIDTEGQEQVFIVGGGILEVMPHMVTVLADSAMRASDFDEAEARRAKAEAERVLTHQKGRMEIAEAQAKLKEAIQQLQALEQFRRRMKKMVG